LQSKDDDEKETKKSVKKKVRTHGDLKAEALEVVDKAVDKATTTTSAPPITTSAPIPAEAAGDVATDSDKEDLVILSALTMSTLPEKPATPQEEESKTSTASTVTDSEVEGSVTGEEDSIISQPPTDKSAEKWVNVKSKETTEQQESSEAVAEGN